MTQSNDKPDVARIAALLEEARLRRARWGAQGPPVNSVVKGNRVVASHNRLYTLSANATYHDFLDVYLQDKMGKEWWEAECIKHEQEAHPLILWSQKHDAFKLRHSTGSLYAQAIGEGVVNHYLRLAFDLHTLDHLVMFSRGWSADCKPEAFSKVRAMN